MSSGGALYTIKALAVKELLVKIPKRTLLRPKTADKFSGAGIPLSTARSDCSFFESQESEPADSSIEFWPNLN